jgi:hypothetical protein
MAETAVMREPGKVPARYLKVEFEMREFALFAGSAAAGIFMISQLPMLIKARRTKDLTSYSFANIGLANFGNVLYAVYIFQVPVGPAWAIHGFNVTTSGLMLFWYLRHGWRPAGRATGSEPEKDSSPRAGRPEVSAALPLRRAPHPGRRAAPPRRISRVPRADSRAGAAR